jgi:hypothetical protein
LLTIIRLDKIKKAKTQRALWEESYPASAQAPGLAERIAAVLRGQP